MVESCLYLWLIVLLRGRQGIYIHHHTAGHTNNKSSVFSILSKIVGIGATHICQCEKMGANLRELYPFVAKIYALPNAFMVDEVCSKPPVKYDKGGVFTLGFLSNITKEKGVLDALAIAKKLLEERVGAVRILVAGPCGDPELLGLIKDAPYAEYLGPLYGDRKADFFRAIDVFVFPTLYPNETEGIVSLEALAHGAPPLVYSRCCTSSSVVDLEDAVDTGDLDALVLRALHYYNLYLKGEFIEIRGLCCSRSNLIRLASTDALNHLLSEIKKDCKGVISS
jgi:glycosyltransferase involved in cell wall biosynthesis